MRKDVRIGLAIASVLVVLLIVYAVIPKKKPTNTVAHVPDEDKVADVGNPGPTEPEPSGPDVAPPVKSTNIFGSAESTTKGSSTDLNRPAADPPPVAENPANTTTDRNWAQILQSGQLPKAERGSSPPPLTGVRTSTPPSNGTGTGTSGKLIDAHSSVEPPFEPAKPDHSGASGTSGRSPTTSSTENPPIVPVGNNGSTSSSRAGERTHVIEKGETLSSIAAAAYGSGKYYTLIKKANPDVNERALKVGATLKIPERAETPSTPVATRNGTTGGSSTAPPLAGVRNGTGSSGAPVNATKEYRVQEGDTLYAIAKKLYGNGGRMHKLHDYNKSVIGDDPDALKVGMTLKLPDPPTAATSSSR